MELDLAISRSQLLKILEKLHRSLNKYFEDD